MTLTYMDFILLYLNKERNLMWSESFFLPKMRHSASFGVLSSCLYFSLLVFTKQITLNSICNTNSSASSMRGWSVKQCRCHRPREQNVLQGNTAHFFFFFWMGKKRKQQKKLYCDCVNKCYKSLEGTITFWWTNIILVSIIKNPLCKNYIIYNIQWLFNCFLLIKYDS